MGFSELPQVSKLASTKERVLRVAVALFQPNPSVPRSHGSQAWKELGSPPPNPCQAASGGRIAKALQVTLCLQVQAMNQIGRCC